MTERQIRGVLLIRGTEPVVGGPCNRTGRPVKGSVLVAPALHPRLYGALMSARAVVCSSGGRTGHMQSICRAKGIPVLRVDPTDLDKIVGEVTLDLERGSVLVGVAGDAGTAPTGATAPPADRLGSACAVIADLGDIRGLNSSGPHAGRVESFFLREEFLCFAAALSPIDALRGGTAVNAYGRAVAEQLQECVEALLPGQRLILRMLDLRSDDAAHITAKATVPREPNPDMGLHGTRWLLRSATYPQALHVMLETLRERLGAEADRVHLSAPFLTDAEEFAKLRPHLGLPTETPLSAFIETPAAVHATSAICAAGADELFVGTKDLVQFYLAADRSNHLVAESYRTRHPAVLDGLRQVIDDAREAGIPARVFALGADLDYYLERLPTPTGYMMCVSELRHVLASR
ncbi:putative PEP-binding protein [Micromonospora sp. KC213]|uniref:putative PEP-binding protein n=1 Tax=Micromonospora sp. KC213 TaxID=2530378 RepID=UPI001A9F3F72|nr:putative PEP-binding protein [Micromonospora sp. KC213]